LVTQNISRTGPGDREEEIDRISEADIRCQTVAKFDFRIVPQTGFGIQTVQSCRPIKL
jgi:hypothetical protein